MKISSLSVISTVFFFFSLLLPLEILSFAEKKTQKELELKLQIPSVTISWKNSLKIGGDRKALVPPKNVEFSFHNFLVKPEFPDIQLPDRFLPLESKVDLELAYTGYAWYLDLLGTMEELFQTGRAYLYKKSPVEALYYFEKTKNKAEKSQNTLYLSASLFWGSEALLKMNKYEKANIWRNQLLKIKDTVSLPYISSVKFSLALQACNKKNYFLCLKFVEERHWEKSIYSKHASFLKAWVLYKQRQFAAAKNIWISLSRYKNEFQIKSLINAGIVSVQEIKNFNESLISFAEAIKLSRKKKKVNSLYERLSIFGKAWSELSLGKYKDALISFRLLKKKYPKHQFKSSILIGEIYTKLRLYREGNLHINEIIHSVESSSELLSESIQIENIILELAWVLFEKKEFSKALRYAIKISHQSPLRKVYPVALILEGLCSYEMGDYAKSFGILKKANDLFQYRTFQGEKKLKNISNLFFSFSAIYLKDYKLAEQTLRDLVQQKNSKLSYVHSLASVWLGEVLIEKKEYGSAERLFLDLPSKTSSYWQAQMGLAWIYFLRKEWKKSASLFEKIFYSSPYGKYASESLFRSAEARFNFGEYDKAIDTFERVEKRFDGTLVSERALYQKIKLLIQRNKLKMAESAILIFMKKHSESVFLDELMFSYALIPFNRLDFTISLNRLKSFIRKNPNSKFLPKAYLKIADIHYNLRDFRKAEIAYSFIVQKYPSYPEARESAYSYAMTKARRNNFSQFLVQARRFIKTAPKDLLSIALSFQIAEIYFSQRKLEYAFEEYLQIFAEHPNSPFAAQALFRISMIHRMNGKIDASLSSYERVLMKYPKHTMRPDVLFALSETLFKIGRYTESEKWLKLFLSEFSEHEYVSFARYYLGICYKKLGQTYNSIEQFSKVIQDTTKVNVELRVNSILELGKILINEKQFVRAKNILLPASELQNRSISSRAKFLLIRILEEEGSGRIGIRYLNLAYEFADDKSIVCKSLLKASAIYKSRKEFSTAQKILEKIERSANLEKCNKIAIKKNKLLSNKIRIH